MKELFEQYGGLVITVMAVMLIVTAVRAVLGSGTAGFLYEQLNGLFTDFMGNTVHNIGSPVENSIVPDIMLFLR